MLKHFRVVKSSALPPKQSVDYHPLQNINNEVIYLRNRALSMWQIGSKLCIDEGRVRSKSRRNPFKVRNPDKPIRMGWTVCKISYKGQYGGYFVCNHVVKVGKKSYVHPQNEENYDIVDQLTAGLKNSGRLVVIDIGFGGRKWSQHSVVILPICPATIECIWKRRKNLCEDFHKLSTMITSQSHTERQQCCYISG